MEGPEVLEQEMSTILGYNTKPTYGWAYTYQGYANQFCGMPVTAPADGTIATLGAWIGTAVAMGGGPASIPFRIVLWDDTNGAVLGYTQVFQSGLSASWPPTAEHFEAAITAVAVTSGHNYRIGVAHGDPNSNTQWNHPYAARDHYYFDGTTYKSYPATFSSENIQTSQQIATYAYFSPSDLGIPVVTLNGNTVTISWGSYPGGSATGFLIPYHPGVSVPSYPSDPYFVWVPIANTSVSFLQPPWLTGTWSTMVIAVDSGQPRTISASSSVTNFTF